MEEVGYCYYIVSIIGIILKKFNSKIFYDLTVKFAKICLAVHHGNLRKLNGIKSLVEGTVKLHKRNAFYKAKNKEI